MIKTSFVILYNSSICPYLCVINSFAIHVEVSKRNFCKYVDSGTLSIGKKFSEIICHYDFYLNYLATDV